MMAPGKYDMRIYAGATFAKTLVWKMGTPPEPVNLTGAAARLSVRSNPGDPLPAIELTTANLRIEIPVGTDGAFTLRLTDEETAALKFLRAEYQLEIEMPDGVVRRLLEGMVLVSPEITR